MLVVLPVFALASMVSERAQDEIKAMDNSKSPILVKHCLKTYH